MSTETEAFRTDENRESRENSEDLENRENPENLENFENPEFEQDEPVAADEFPAYGDHQRNAGMPESDMPESGEPLTSDPAMGELSTDPDLPENAENAENVEPAESEEPTESAESEEPTGFEAEPMALEAEPTGFEAESAVPEGVAKAENVGARDAVAGADSLVSIAARDEFLSRWSQIQVSFVTDPANAVESAEVLLRDIGAAILASFEDRGSEFAAAGHAATDTEQMRLALLQYHDFIGAVLPA